MLKIKVKLQKDLDNIKLKINFLIADFDRITKEVSKIKMRVGEKKKIGDLRKHISSL